MNTLTSLYIFNPTCRGKSDFKMSFSREFHDSKLLSPYNTSWNIMHFGFHYPYDTRISLYLSKLATRF